MTSLVRKNAWNSGGDFNNPDLFWYAKGVGRMMERPLANPASWWFFAAIHGEYVNPNTSWYPNPAAFPAWTDIQGPPQVPASPLPDPATMQTYWNQCQHGSWYFLPWHRGYLYALEAQLRADIASLGGPRDWALPYWDYFGGAEGAQAQLPPAFAQKLLPDGSSNPLYVAMRYGPDGDGNVYIPTDAWASTHPADPNWSYGDVSAACMVNDLYTGSDASTPLPGFGGPQTDFEHNGGLHGNMESNPHDLVHVYTGGPGNNNEYGLMADPGTAALDPIFYLHHCNIDRLWAAWNSSGRANPASPQWLQGPLQEFTMPMPGGEAWQYTPGEVNSTASLSYDYDDLAVQTASAASAATRRLQLLGWPSPAGTTAAAAAPRPHGAVDLLGTNQDTVRLTDKTAATVPVQLDSAARHAVTLSFNAASPSKLPDQVYLRLDRVRGTFDAEVVEVYIDLPAQPQAEDLRRCHAGNVALFGMRLASTDHGPHGGEGLSFILDVSHLFDQLHLRDKLSGDQVQVTLRRHHGRPGSGQVTVGRVSLFRQPN